MISVTNIVEMGVGPDATFHLEIITVASEETAGQMTRANKEVAISNPS